MLELKILEEKGECLYREEAQALWRKEYETRYNTAANFQRGKPLVVLKNKQVVGCCFLTQQLMGQKYYGIDLQIYLEKQADFEVSKFTITSDNGKISRKERKIIMVLLVYGITLLSCPSDRFLIVIKPAFHLLLTSLFDFNFIILSKTPIYDSCPQDSYWQDKPPPLLLLFDRPHNLNSLTTNFSFLYN